MALLQQGFVLMSMACVTTKDHVDPLGLDLCLRPEYHAELDFISYHMVAPMSCGSRRDGPDPTPSLGSTGEAGLAWE